MAYSGATATIARRAAAYLTKIVLRSGETLEVRIHVPTAEAATLVLPGILKQVVDEVDRSERERTRIREVQLTAYKKIEAMVGRVEAAAGRVLSLDEERLLWFLLREGRLGWLPPADWPGHGDWGLGSAGAVTAHRTMVLVVELQQMDPGLVGAKLYETVMTLEPWKRRAGPRSSSFFAPVAWVFSLLLEDIGAPASGDLRALVFDLAGHANRDSVKRNRAGKSEAVRQALRARDRQVGEARLAYARRMARAWFKTDAWKLEERIQARRGNPPPVAP